MNYRTTELAQNTFLLSIGYLVPKIVGLVLLPLLTTYLTQSHFGLYELTLTVSAFCVPLISVQIQQAVFRFLLDPTYQSKQVITTGFVFVTGAFGLMAFPICLTWYWSIKTWQLSFLFTGCYILEALVSWAAQTVRGKGDNLAYSLAYVVYSLSFLVLIGVFLWITKSLAIVHVARAMFFAYLASFVFLFVSHRLDRELSWKAYNKQLLVTLLAYSGPMLISGISLWVVNLSDRFFVSAYLGLEVTAIYAVANRIPNIFNSLYSIFNLAWTETASKLTSQEKLAGYYTVSFQTFFDLMIGLLCVLITVSPLVFHILINKQYANSYGLMSGLYLGVFFSSLVSFLGALYVGEKKTKEVGISSAVGALINLLINLFFMKKYGVYVAIFSTVISFFIICIYRAVDIRKHVPISYNIPHLLIGMACLMVVSILNIRQGWWIVGCSAIITLGYNWQMNQTVLFACFRGIYHKLFQAQ